MADLRISELTALAGANLAAGDLLPIVDVSASETKKITVTDLVGNATTLIADATIPSAKVLFGSGSIVAASLATDAVTTAKIQNDAVTAAKLADESTVDLVTTLPGSGAFVGQIALDTDDNNAYIWNGSTWVSFKAAGSVGSVVGSTAGTINIVVTTSGSDVTISATLDNTSAAAQFLAGPSGSAGAVSYRTITSADLPTATTSSKGAVSVNGNGLTLSGDEIRIDNTVTANTSQYHLTQYNAKGLVTAGRQITAADLPAATSSVIGGVYPGSGLSVSTGQLNHTNSATPGTYTKVSIDAQGHVTTGTTLGAADVPSLDASKITTGEFGASRLASDAVTGAKLSDSSTVQFGGAGSTAGIVTFPTADFKGQYFWDELNGDLYLWSGSSWLPVTITSGELIFSGTYNANTNLVASTTTAGAAAGYSTGAALPAANSTNARHYLVISQSGTGTGNAPPEPLAPPDMILSNGATYDLIDVSNAIAGQTATNISFTPYGGIAATNVQTAIQELEDEKLAKAGGTVTGNLEIGTTGSLTFEGATANNFETTLAVTDPTADRTITLPDQSGTVLISGGGSIVDADISASAEIAVSKLADGAARQLLQTDAAGTGVEWTNNIDIPGTLDVTGAAVFDSSVSVTGALTKSGSNVVTVGDTGTVTSTMIADGTIVNADINASAAIADTKLATISTAGKVSNSATTATSANTASAIVARDASGNFTAGTITATGFSGSGASLTSLTAGNLSGTIPSGVLGNSSLFVGTTSVALNRASANQGLTGISSIALPGATSGTVTVTPAATAGTTAITIPATSGTLVTTGDTATVTNAMLAGSIADSKLSTISTAGKVSNSATTAVSTNTASAIVARDASGNFAAGTITAALTGNASTATALATARNIQGVAFDGTANITVVTAGSGISVTGTAVANTGVLSVNGSTGAITNVAVTNTAQSFSAAQRGSISALTSAATVTPDFAVANNFSLTLGHNVTLANPTNLTAGQSGSIVITQGAATAYTVAYGANWKFSGGTPTMSTGLSSVSTLVYYVESASRITAQLLTNVT